jgi:hypothetical protein
VALAYIISDGKGKVWRVGGLAGALGVLVSRLRISWAWLGGGELALAFSRLGFYYWYWHGLDRVRCAISGRGGAGQLNNGVWASDEGQTMMSL